MPPAPFSDDTAIETIALRVIDRTLPRVEWTHAGHAAFALWLARHRRDLASIQEVRMLIMRYNEATGTANTDISGYHHTITIASMRAAAAHLHVHAPDTAVHVVLDAFMESRFGRPDWLLAHWKRDTLFSGAARKVWVDPDIAPLDF